MASIPMAREAWTDERLDDLKGSVDKLDRRTEAGFTETREEFRSVRGEMREEFRALRGEMAQQFSMQNRIIVIGFLGVIATILTQI